MDAEYKLLIDKMDELYPNWRHMEVCRDCIKLTSMDEVREGTLVLCKRCKDE